MRKKENNMGKFKKGDVVELKSGGPAMTIQDVGDYVSLGGTENSAHCIWFVGDIKYEGYFDEDNLMPYVARKSVVVGVGRGKSKNIIRR
jgi:uncharacterized protein YodC (DUF2158 family)